MVVKKKSERRVKKENYWTRLQDVASKYKNVMFVNADNVSSCQISKLRVKLREIDAYMIMGKNTLMKAALTDANTKAEGEESEKLDKIINQLKGNTNLIFSNGDLTDVKACLDSEVRESPAKAGMLAPKDVSVPVGPTGLDPKNTQFFQNLQIQTKIVKGQIDITSQKQVIFKDTRVDSTQAVLLDKLKIYPFEYKMRATKILQDGNIFDAAVLNLTTENILSRFMSAIKLQSQLALKIGMPTKCSAPHSLLKGFNNLVAISAETGFQFTQAQAILDVAPSRPTNIDEVKEIQDVEPEKVEEQVEVNMMGLFGDESDDEY